MGSGEVQERTAGCRGPAGHASAAPTGSAPRAASCRDGFEPRTGMHTGIYIWRASRRCGVPGQRTRAIDPSAYQVEAPRVSISMILPSVPGSPVARSIRMLDASRVHQETGVDQDQSGRSRGSGMLSAIICSTGPTGSRMAASALTAADRACRSTMPYCRSQAWRTSSPEAAVAVRPGPSASCDQLTLIGDRHDQRHDPVVPAHDLPADPASVGWPVAVQNLRNTSASTAASISPHAQRGPAEPRWARLIRDASTPAATASISQLARDHAKALPTFLRQLRQLAVQIVGQQDGRLMIWAHCHLLEAHACPVNGRSGRSSTATGARRASGYILGIVASHGRS